ncbi:hypothetical protein COW99_04305 [Candidatus Roizmanbacteria bacterium CG22_combo_CG10-13_8_21_14_all_38_20]|uniref:2'-deoxynucleoside 5'-phosphate N-hydrolase 1 n=1 Tax=Candidatus Roizmanbacteria bacterium CG22_combo_CG10-13_8_21_14_all_38_20 TaxID=1974862 RepID=A0A2H0BUN8_9BACT|nr:MAG: hypothetical protein COW99_04305 [Candidatus Roizmanbacteria bacterium CG22_combo_CG10-13_8_21_14_all_38_20]PJC30517.1 MAG: hypothetical protein CO050_06045 [Candidatus Roizmanbacteria bacterium CG_4_9_14_0_2_um_filter_38_17]
MRIFIAGIMQGNKKELGIHSQDYRERITSHLRTIFPNVEIIDPDLTDPNRLGYNNKEAEEMFFRYCKIAGEVDFLISFIPEASMGSAIEMWVAHNAGIPILTISPLRHNWVVRLLSLKVFSDLNTFEQEFGIHLLKKLKLM